MFVLSHPRGNQNVRPALRALELARRSFHEIAPPNFSSFPHARLLAAIHRPARAQSRPRALRKARTLAWTNQERRLIDLLRTKLGSP